MKCIKCGHGVYQSVTTEAIELDEGLLVIRNVPCYKCEMCDEIQFTGDIVKQIERIREEAKKYLNEIVVVNFSNVA